mmetsp:Transcript_54351/g.151383  ORF Transcript_54351/g.151383 Transcript_54351/m.151383 type:complete len:539 (-) Transcript_54351:115-1731(-)|eukprot:CAMPEP_0117525806 /NCGR_PEP_ID=MMETSP0784-20121206/35961_1 /TAXON_ID=39447 /ORGANISM="" /LENGTH=538 /DNA_ID=CAMNT_0005322017 /DNA_START=93 /DNA_END=1709 /DNA_ORIENTATION=-
MSATWVSAAAATGTEWVLEVAARHLGGGHLDAYDPVKGGLLDGGFDVWLLLVVTVFVIGLGSLAAGAGVGGGGLFVPLFAFVLGVGAKAAVPMSKATILGGAMGNMISIALARHPDPAKSRPLIDYEASTFMQSGELLGVIFGVLLNMLLPEIAIIVFLALLLSFNGFKTLQKGVQKYKEETVKMRSADREATTNNLDELERQSEDSPAPTNFGSGLAALELWDIMLYDKDYIEKTTDSTDEGTGDTPSSGTNTDDTNATHGSDSKRRESKNTVASSTMSQTDAQKALLQTILDQDAQQFPLWSWVLLALMTLYTIAYALIKKAVLSTCDPITYWLWYFSPVPVLFGFMYVTAKILKKRHEDRVRAGYKFVGDGEEKPAYRDMKWTDETLFRFPSVALLAGVSAGLLGIGGGMVIGPLFIQLDMQPKVGSSSCAFMILWTAASGVVQYVFAGKIGIQFILYGVFVGLISGQMGQRIVDAALKKTGRPSYVIFLLGGIVSVACVAMTATGTFKVVQAIAAGENVLKLDLYDFQCHAGHH